MAMTEFGPTPMLNELVDLTGCSCKGLVVGIASLAWAAAEHFNNAGTELVITKS